MKKMFTMLMMAMMAIVFTSCEDEYIADTLEGTWEGNMYIGSEWGGHYYEAASTEITFLIDPFRFTKGSGYWVDYYRDAPWGSYVANHINWSVSNGVIYVYFVEDGDRIEIRDYRLNRNRFVGTIYEGGQFVDFDLYNVRRPYDYWDDYRWGYDYWYNDYYYASTRAGNADSTQILEKPKRVIRVPKTQK